MSTTRIRHSSQRLMYTGLTREIGDSYPQPSLKEIGMRIGCGRRLMRRKERRSNGTTIKLETENLKRKILLKMFREM